MRPRTRLLAAMAAGFVALPLLAGEAVAIDQSIRPGEDSVLGSAAPDTPHGGSYLSVGGSEGGRNNSVLKFYLNSFNSGSLKGIHILDATLQMTYAVNDPFLRTIGIYSSTSNENLEWKAATVTWNSFDDPAGSANGGDLLATAASDAAINGVLRWSSPALAGYIQSVIDLGLTDSLGGVPVTLLVRDTGTSDSYATFWSVPQAIHNDLQKAPFLIVTYTRPLAISTTATSTLHREILWTIDKSVDPASWTLFRGDSGTSRYTIRLDKLEAIGEPTVSGGITITNPTANSGFSATIATVSDDVCGTPAAVGCPGGMPQILSPGAVLNCTYAPALTSGGSCENTVAVTTNGDVRGGVASAFAVGGPSVVVGFATVNVDDANDDGDAGPISASTQYTYDRTFTCDGDDGAHANTAKIVETGRSDNASVTVDCRALQVSKDAATAFTRTWSWEIDKTADQDSLELAEGEAFEVSYGVALNAESEDSDHQISGTIAIANNTPIAATLADVSDQVGGASANVTCPGGVAQTLAAGANLACSYTADVSDASATQNTATVTLRNFAYNAAGQATQAGTTDFGGTAPVSFSDPTTEVDRCVDVSDSLDTGGVLPAEACAPDASFDYLRFVGPFATCGEQQASNTAAFLGDTGAAGESTHVVNLNVVGCDTGGCTLGQGYWKTHSEHGPAPYDANWANLGSGGADTAFFDSGQSYYEVMWTAPRGGNAYYILAHQYIGATLNQLNGADIGAVQTAHDAATELFGSYAPEQIGRLKGNSAVRKAFIAYAGILGDYNEGSTGPGQCDQDRTVAR